VDHVIPVTRGGEDEESNWVTTSMAHNSAKMNWTVEELGWKIHPQGDSRAWDGMLRWFLEYTARNPQSLIDAGMRGWHRAATIAVSTI
jgi:hypothetical protein